MEEAAAEEEDSPLEVGHMVLDQVEACPYDPSCGEVAKWLHINGEQASTFAITYKNDLKMKFEGVLLNCI